MKKRLFAFNVLGELNSRIIEAIAQAEAEAIADKVQEGVPVRPASTSDFPSANRFRF